ncbi:hypothetical protein L1049_017213 [Liquidambar formosana]|uniref:Late embryogenesis abundant protein Lea5 n=1 Tax=Liquidambar formosana TaxID=63359 RepID=A0AAP0S2N8_LIQFO
MARSLSNAKFLAASVVDSLSLVICRRGYAAASQGMVSASVSKGGSRTGIVGRVEERAVIKEDSSWGPDPVTGYYRPVNRGAEIDVAELRDTLLNNKVRRAH